MDRRAWIAGNVRTLSGLFDIDLPGADSKLVAWEGGAFLGLLARAVLAQYDPYRDLLLVVYPNLGDIAQGDGLRWLIFHEVTHLAQFRGAPWMRDHIVKLGNEVLATDNREWVRELGKSFVERLPELAQWARDALQGKAEGTPLLDLMPPEQREIVMRLHGLVTVLEGHATYVTDLIAERVIPNYDQLQRRIKEQRKRPPIIKLLEAIGGIQMKRQQYVLGRDFCEAVWKHGGPGALAPAWVSPEGMPSIEEVKDPQAWLSRTSGRATVE